MASSTEEKVLKILSEEDMPLTQRQISRKTEISRPTVRKTVQDLKERGIVKIEEVGSAYLHRRVDDA